MEKCNYDKTYLCSYHPISLSYPVYFSHDVTKIPSMVTCVSHRRSTVVLFWAYLLRLRVSDEHTHETDSACFTKNWFTEKETSRVAGTFQDALPNPYNFNNFHDYGKTFVQ